MVDPSLIVRTFPLGFVTFRSLHISSHARSFPLRRAELENGCVGGEQGVMNGKRKKEREKERKKERVVRYRIFLDSEPKLSGLTDKCEWR